MFLNKDRAYIDKRSDMGGWLKRVNRQLRKHWNDQDETGLIIYPRGSFGPPGGGGGGLTVVAREVTSAHRQLLYDRHHTKGNTSRWNERNTVSSNERNTVGKVIQIKLMQMIQSKAVQHIKLSYIRNKLYTDNRGSFQANTNQIRQYGIGIWNNLTMFDFENKQLLMLFAERKDKGAYERDSPPKNSIASINQTINMYFRIFLQGYCWQVIWFITVNNPRTDIGKPVFMTDLQMHWYKLCDDNLENNDTIFGESNYNI